MAEESMTKEKCQRCQGLGGIKFVVEGGQNIVTDCPDCQGTGKSTQQSRLCPPVPTGRGDASGQEAEALEYLAGLECPCLDVHRDLLCEACSKHLTWGQVIGGSTAYHGDWCSCQGTGLRFQGLKRECTQCGGKHDGCIPVSVAEGFLWLVERLLHDQTTIRLTLQDYGQVGVRYYVAWSDEQPAECHYSLPLALFAAVKAGVEAES